jgi:hypothetical protein
MSSMAHASAESVSSQQPDRPERSRNAKAQARHRAKRKAYIEQVRGLRRGDASSSASQNAPPTRPLMPRLDSSNRPSQNSRPLSASPQTRSPPSRPRWSRFVSSSRKTPAFKRRTRKCAVSSAILTTDISRTTGGTPSTPSTTLVAATVTSRNEKWTISTS